MRKVWQMSATVSRGSPYIQDAIRTMCLYQGMYDAYRAGHQGRLELPKP